MGWCECMADEFACEEELEDPDPAAQDCKVEDDNPMDVCNNKPVGVEEGKPEDEQPPPDGTDGAFPPDEEDPNDDDDDVLPSYVDPCKPGQYYDHYAKVCKEVECHPLEESWSKEKCCDPVDLSRYNVEACEGPGGCDPDDPNYNDEVCCDPAGDWYDRERCEGGLTPDPPADLDDGEDDDPGDVVDPPIPGLCDPNDDELYNPDYEWDAIAKECRKTDGEDPVVIDPDEPIPGDDPPIPGLCNPNDPDLYNPDYEWDEVAEECKKTNGEDPVVIDPEEPIPGGDSPGGLNHWDSEIDPDEPIPGGGDIFAAACDKDHEFYDPDKWEIDLHGDCVLKDPVVPGGGGFNPDDELEDPIPPQCDEKHELYDPDYEWDPEAKDCRKRKEPGGEPENPGTVEPGPENPGTVEPGGTQPGTEPPTEETKAKCGEPSEEDKKNNPRGIEALALINKFRQEQVPRLDPIGWNPKLASAAAQLAAYNMSNERGGHIDAEFTDPLMAHISRAKKFGYNSTVIVENAGANYKTAVQAVEEWKSSFGVGMHRENMIQPNTREGAVVFAGNFPVFIAGAIPTYNGATRENEYANEPCEDEEEETPLDSVEPIESVEQEVPAPSEDKNLNAELEREIIAFRETLNPPLRYMKAVTSSRSKATALAISNYNRKMSGPGEPHYDNAIEVTQIIEFPEGVEDTGEYIMEQLLGNDKIRLLLEYPTVSEIGVSFYGDGNFNSLVIRMDVNPFDGFEEYTNRLREEYALDPDGYVSKYGSGTNPPSNDVAGQFWDPGCPFSV